MSKLSVFMRGKKSSQNKNAVDKYWVGFFVIAIVGLIVVTFSLAETKELPMTIIGAVLGVAMTACATFFLFKGQSNQELKQEKDVEIFKSRLEAYKMFLDALCRYVEVRDEAAKSILKFRTAALAMHSDDQQMIETNRTVGDIIKMYESPDIDDEKLLISLFNISDYFRKALYAENTSVRCQEYNESIKTLNVRFEQGTDASDALEENKDTIQEEQSIEKDSESIGSWNEYIKSVQARGWSSDIVNDQISLTNPDKSVAIRIRKPRKGTFYVIEVVTKDDNVELTKALKAQFKGARSGGTWWRELTSLPNYGIRSGQLTASLEDNSKARTVIVKWIDKLTNFII